MQHVIEIGRMSCVAAELRAHECCKVEFDDRVRRFCCELFQRFRLLWKSCNVSTDMKRSRAKSRDDITALMHVTYNGQDALALQQDTEM